ncbi:MAG: membrane protein insertion efficiency factor YidD [Methylobacteriaceae bacterium]|nr:membrane protein insertion efficiency factor YidD [Methylobacteriaceae bacterium]
MPEASPARRVATGLIRAYQLTFSAIAGRTCRHLPTCSEYAAEAIARHGLWPGGWMAFARICRCGPGGTAGLDFVPPVLPSAGRWYAPWRWALWRGTRGEP